MNSFPEALKEKQGTQSQVEFAESLNVSQSGISRVMNGKRGKGWKLLANIFAKHPDTVPFFVSDYADISGEYGKIHK